MPFFSRLSSTALGSRARVAALTEQVRAFFTVGWPSQRQVAHVAAPGRGCPRCHRPTGSLALLTSTQSYFACTACHHRWSGDVAMPTEGA